MFCQNCGAKVDGKCKFCSNCGEELVLPKKKDSSPIEADKDEKPVKSFSTYRSEKSSEWYYKTRKVKTNVKKADDVVISLGMLVWSEKDVKLKPIRGKRLALRVSPDESYNCLLEKAFIKWSNYHPESTIANINYILTFESGDEALYLPGTKSPFNLKKYKDEVGKDFKRIVLYLCASSDKTIAEKAISLDDNSPSSDESDTVCEEPSSKIPKISNQEEQEVEDEKYARELQEKYNDELPFVDEDDEPLPKFQFSNDKGIDDSQKDQSVSDILTGLNANVKIDSQFFILVRRSASIQRIFSLWSRQRALVSPEYRLMVKYIGEDGIDSGAVAKEFLTNTIKNIGEFFFPYGAPKDSMSDVQNGNFFCIGQIIAISLVEGGPPPQFLHKSVFNLLVERSVDVRQLDPEKHFVPADREIFNAIRNDPTALSDTIIEHGYTGMIDLNHAQEIIETVMISVMSKRITYMSEVAKGLELLNVMASLQQHTLLFEPLFVLKEDTNISKIDANYVVSILQPNYSSEQSSKRILEETIVDHIQDFVNDLESSNVEAHLNEITANIDEGNEQPNDPDETVPYGLEADLSPAGLLGWLTGQKHKPLFGEQFFISLRFDHDCMSRNPKHKKCFPHVLACAKELVIPTTHMKTYEELKESFVIAMSKGQAFGRS